MAAAVEHGGPVDILVNNAAHPLGRHWTIRWASAVGAGRRLAGQRPGRGDLLQARAAGMMERGRGRPRGGRSRRPGRPGRGRRWRSRGRVLWLRRSLSPRSAHRCHRVPSARLPAAGDRAQPTYRAGGTGSAAPVIETISV
jgi:hypothetical protein